MKCKNCMAELEEGTLFCPECGARVDNDSDKTVVLQEDLDAAEEAGNEQPVFAHKVYEEPVRQGQAERQADEEPVRREAYVREAAEESAPAGGDEPELCFCPNCGNKIESNSVFCEFCGYRMDGAQEETPVYSEEPAPKKKSKLPLIIGGVAAVAVVAAAGIFALPKVMDMVGGKSKGDIPTELMYIKDKGIYGVSLKSSKKKPVEYTDKFADSDALYSAVDDFETGFQLVSDDGKYHFIIENVEYSGSMTYTLSYVKGKKEPVKIDSGIEGYYKVTEDNKIVYMKNDNLYVSDLKDKTKLASSVDNFYLDKAGKNVMWEIYNHDGTSDIYYQDLAQKKDKIKIDSDTSLIGMTSDLSKIMLRKEDSVYMVKNQGDKEKLVGDVDDIMALDVEKGTFFYTTSVDSKMKAMDFVDDDLAASDAQIKEPVRSDYERQETTGIGYYSYTRTVLDDKYYDDLSKYQEKQQRDQLRQQLKDEEIESPYTELYYYADGQKNLVTSEFMDSLSYFYITEADREANKNFGSYLIYTKTNAADMKKVKLSEISYIGEIYYLMDEARGKSVTYCVYAGGKEAELDLDGKKLGSTRKDAKNNQVYMLIKDEDADYEDGSDLFSMSLNASDLGKMEERDSDVNSLELVSNGNVYYLKDTNDKNVGDLYCNGDSVLSDVSVYSVQSVPKSSVVLCISDPNKDKNRGTLTLVKGKKAEKLAEDVNDYYAFGENSVAMLTEYNYDRMKGDLKYYNGKEAYLIDSDVRNFFRTY
ncbi:MAG: zinc ribbon domain-containing protein [Enterocloster asparagiformis]|nr:zinc ribbon domain-containing protein [Enterocloster asparagiformis]